jgi:hypothetical protein
MVQTLSIMEFFVGSRKSEHHLPKEFLHDVWLEMKNKFKITLPEVMFHIIKTKTKMTHIILLFSVHEFHNSLLTSLE